MKLLTGLFLMLSSMAALATILPYQLQVTNPERNIGYFVGDIIQRTADIDIASPCKLSVGSLPAKGMTRNGIQLRDIQLTEQLSSKSTHYHLQLFYQVFNRGNYAKELVLPKETLILSNSGKLMSLTIPSWKFQVSPLASHSETYIEEDMSPYRGPMLVKFGYMKAFLATSLMLVILSLAGLFYIHGDVTWFPGMSGPFAASYRKISTLPDTTEGLQQAVASLHQAFNLTYGESLFQEKIDKFLALHPEFKNIKPEIEDFFETSNQVLFCKNQDQLTSMTITNILKFCAICRHCERGLV